VIEDAIEEEREKTKDEREKIKDESLPSSLPSEQSNETTSQN
jgi:hypothetical protein